MPGNHKKIQGLAGIKEAKIQDTTQKDATLLEGIMIKNNP